MTQTFESFNDLWTKAHDMEIHLNKNKKSDKDYGRIGNSIIVALAPKERVTYVFGSSFSWKAPNLVHHEMKSQQSLGLIPGFT